MYLNFRDLPLVHSSMDTSPRISCTQFTREDGMDAFWFDGPRGKGWIVRLVESPVRFYHPTDKMWNVAHAIPSWTPYFVPESEALRLLNTLEKPPL